MARGKRTLISVYKPSTYLPEKIQTGTRKQERQTMKVKKVKFHILSAGNDHRTFSINETTGDIYLSERLQSTEYILTVQAADGGTPPNTASKTFTIKVMEGL